MAEIIFVAIPQETVNDESVRILSWKVTSGSRVDKDQLLCDIETSKAVVEIEAPAAGTIIYSAAEGDEVPVGSTICQIVPEGMTPVDMDPGTRPPALAAVATKSPLPLAEDPVVPVAASAPRSMESNADAHPDDDLRPARLTPLAARLAAEFQFEKDSFPRGSLVRRDDVLRRAGKLPPLPVFGARATAVSAPVEGRSESIENAPVSGVAVEWKDLPRRKVFEGRVLGQGQARTVQSFVSTSVRVPYLRFRLEKLGLTNIGLSAVILFEAARLLRKYPEFNAVHDRGKIGLYANVNVGWAIDGGQGLMVPVIADADRQTPNEIVDTMHSQIEKYVDGTLSPADFLGGTFTLSDLSGDGISYFQPLISQGQSAILGIGGEVDSTGKETLFLTLAFDHQLTEGKKAAQFVRELAGRLETHASIANSPSGDAPKPDRDPYCSLCLRDGKALLAIKEMLVRSEIPAGFVCSVCLAGQS